MITEAQALMMFDGMTMEDMRIIGRAFTAQVNYIQKQAAFSFKVNDKVSFRSRSRGIVNGVIIKVNQKTIKVQAGFQRYNCSPTILTKI